MRQASVKITNLIKQWLLGDLFTIAQDPLGTFSRASIERPITRYRITRFTTYYISDLNIIKELMLDQKRCFDKWTLSWREISNVIGKSLLVSSGDFWKKQRRIAAPSFQAHKIEDLSPIFIEAARECAIRWNRASVNKQQINVSNEMMITTLVGATRTLFGSDIDAKTYTELSARIPELFKSLSSRISKGGLPIWVPTRRNRVFKRSLKPVNDLVSNMIKTKRTELMTQPQTDGHKMNLIESLIAATDEETGQGMNDRELRDEVMGFFFAGHETTTVALTWLWIVLYQHKDFLNEIRIELLTEIGARDPELSDLPRLQKLNCALLESMRLYPPVWLMERRAIKQNKLANLHLQKNDFVLFCTYALHRDPRIWESPDAFMPSRFEGDWRSRIDRYSYMPFGAGPRTCIGLSFALIEMQLIMAYLIPRYDVCIAEVDQVKPITNLSLRTNKDILMSVARTSIPL